MTIFLQPSAESRCRPRALLWSNKMKYILIPLTVLLWYLSTYYGVYIALIGMGFVFSLSWIWLIMGYIFLIGAVFGISNGIPSLLRLLILKVYGINWFSCIIHSLAGVFGIAQIIRFFRATPPEIVIGDESLFFLTGMWEVAPFKTVFIALPFLGLVIALIWSSIFAPVYIKLTGDQI